MVKRLLALCLLGVAAGSQAAVVWYGGDFDSRNGAPNEINGLIADARTYDDFTLVGSTLISAVSSNNLFDSFTATQAAVEIRTGMSSGNGGNIVFSGTFAASFSPTGRSGFGMQEMNVRVSGLAVALGAGTYHLSVTPIGNGSGRSYVSSAAGANGVGTPLGNGNSFVNSGALAFNFAPASYLGSGNWDFSLAVESGGLPPLDIFPTTLNPIRGVVVSGNLASLTVSDDNRLVHRPGIVFTTGQAPVSFEVVGTAPEQNASELRFRIESHATSPSVSQQVELYNYNTGAYVPFTPVNLTTADVLREVVVSTGASNYIQAGTREVKARISFKATGPVFVYPWETRVDLAMWRQTP
jgi:hypothetical protein